MKKILLGVILFSIGFSANIEKLKPITVDVKASSFNGYYDKNNNFSYINSDKLDSWVERDTHGVLKKVAGINAVNVGGATTIFLNGFASNQTKVLYRGVDIYDPTSPQGTPYLDVISLLGVDRIEIIRGAASSYYGNSAVAGVINIVPSTKANTMYSLLAGDSFLSQYVKTGVADDWYKFLVSYSNSNQSQLSWVDTDSEKDTEKKQSVEIDSEFKINDKSLLSLFYSGNNLDSDLDGWNSHVLANHSIYGLKLNQEIDSKSGLELSYSGSSLRRDYDSGTSLYEGNLNELDAKFNKKFLDKDLVLGFTKRTEKAKTTYFSEKEQESQSFYNIFSEESLLNYSLGSRVTSYTNDKAVFTYNASLWKKIAEYEFKLNYSTGYRQPTLYEKYDSDSGDPNLLSETSRLIDFGLAYQGIDNAIIRTNIFSSIVNNKIDWISTGGLSGTYMNVTSDTLIDGYSVGLDLLENPLAKEIKAEYVYLNSRDSNGQSLRVPKQKVVLDVMFDFFGADLSLLYTKVASRLDTGSVGLPSYQTVDLALVKKYDNSEIYIKGVNILGENYQEISGYNTLKNVWYAGFKKEF